MTNPDVARWELPDTDVCSAAMRLVFEVSPEYLANHCIRSYLFARELAAARGLAAYDDELVYLGCILHDLGITDFAPGDQRFEIDGADGAARFLREHGMADDRVATVWQSIALHTSVGLAERFGPEQAVCFAGISMDVSAIDVDLLSPGFAERVHAAWPRHDLGFRLAGAIAGGIATNPMKAPPFSLPAHLHELVNGDPSMTFFEFVGWGDQPGPT